MTGHTAAALDEPAKRAALAALDRIAADGRDGIWIEVLDPDEVLTAARHVDTRLSAGDALPLVGMTVAVKGNVDVVGHRTTAGCPSFGHVADRSAPAVRALERAGAVVVGITNLDQFATGLVGTRSPYGVCPNAHWPALVSGGSSSGSAVAVAAGLVDLGLGTDTAGSGRVPAAANGIVGIKPTRGRTSTLGVVPACRSLDCVSVMARTLDEADVATRIMAADPADPEDAWRRVHELLELSDRPLRIGIPTSASLTFDGDESGLGRFVEAVDLLASALDSTQTKATFVHVDLEPFVEAGALLYDGAFIAERYEAVGSFIAKGSSDLDPIVRDVIDAGSDVLAWEAFRDQSVLMGLRRQTAPTWGEVDAMVVPSVPRLPTVAEVSAEPITANSMLGTYTNFVNLMDLTALTMPIGPATTAGPPTSVTLIGPAWSDDVLVHVARLTELGAGGHRP